MNWDDARILLALRQARNLSDAARALRVSHTTVARRLEALGRALDVRLVERTADGLRLTGDGAELARLAEPMEAAADAMLRRLAGAEQRLAGRVRVTTTEALGARVLAPRLAELAARHAELTIDLVLDPRTFSLARREADLAVRLVRPRERTTVGRRIGRVAYAAYAAPAYLAGPRAPERLLTYDAPAVGDELVWLQRKFPGAQVALRSASTLALASAAAAGTGIAALPCFVGDADPALVRIAPPGEIAASEVWLVLHRDLRRSARAQAVASFLAEVVTRVASVLDGSAPTRGDAPPASPSGSRRR